MLKVYVAQICSSDEMQAEEDDPTGSENVQFPQFASVFADFGPEEISELQKLALADLNDHMTDDEVQFGLDDFQWVDSGWLKPEVGRRHRSIVGSNEVTDLFINVQETDLQ